MLNIVIYKRLNLLPAFVEYTIFFFVIFSCDIKTIW